MEVKEDHERSIVGLDVLGFDVNRIPVGFVDIDTRTGEIISGQEVKKSTAWKDVPAPAI